MRRSTAASASICLYSVAATSALTGPETISQISAITSVILRPDLAMSEGFVVTPSSRPVAASSRISEISAVSTKNFMAHFPGMRWMCQAYSMERPNRSTRVSILLPYPFDAPFTYEAEGVLAPGTLVRVPLGPRTGGGGGVG